jgi:hypothetical protein
VGIELTRYDPCSIFAFDVFCLYIVNNEHQQ